MQPTRIHSLPELDIALAASAETPLLLFKHSLTCPVSSVAYQAYAEFLAERNEGDGVLYGLVEIQNAREVSTAAAERTGVRHESPQALLVKDGEAVWHASHWDLSVEAFRAAVDAAGAAPTGTERGA